MFKYESEYYDKRSFCKLWSYVTYDSNEDEQYRVYSHNENYENLCPLMKGMLDKYLKLKSEYNSIILHPKMPAVERAKAQNMKNKLDKIYNLFYDTHNILYYVKKVNESDYINIAKIPVTNDLSKIDILLEDQMQCKKYFENGNQIIYLINKKPDGRSFSYDHEGWPFYYSDKEYILHIYKTEGDDINVCIYNDFSIEIYSRIEETATITVSSIIPYKLNTLVSEKVKEKRWITDGNGDEINV